ELGRFEEPIVDACADLTVAHGTSVNAVTVTFQAHLYPSLVHTLDPWRWPSSSWATSVWVLPDAVGVRPGDRLRVRYSRRVPGRADGLTCDLSPVSGDAAALPERQDIHLRCP